MIIHTFDYNYEENILMKASIFTVLIFAFLVSCSTINKIPPEKSEIERNAEKLKEHQHNDFQQINYYNNWGKPESK